MLTGTQEIVKEAKEGPDGRWRDEIKNYADRPWQRLVLCHDSEEVGEGLRAGMDTLTDFVNIFCVLSNFFFLAPQLHKRTAKCVS